MAIQRSVVPWLLASTLLAAACGGRSALLTGQGTDAGPGTGAGSDAGSDVDAGPDADATSGLDARAVAEAGSAPDARADAGPDAEAGAPPANVVVLFGGVDQANTLFGDTWEWDGAAWAMKSSTGPEARRGHAMATLAGKVVLFGGRTPSTFFADTWEWDGHAWTVRTPASGPSPSARAYHCMASLGDKVVLYGGHVTNDAGTELPFIDTWEWNGDVWTQRQSGTTTVPNPGFRSNAAMATVGGVAALYGGFDDISRTLGDTWTWNSSAGVGWSSPATANFPTARLDHAMADLGGKATMFGGFDGFSMYLGDTWTWDGSAWQKVGVPLLLTPSARAGHSMATSNGTRVLLFGGYDGTRSLADTWQFDGAAWIQRATTGPGARQFASMSSR